jgi:hypothetical protein
MKADGKKDTKRTKEKKRKKGFPALCVLSQVAAALNHGHRDEMTVVGNCGVHRDRFWDWGR